MKKCFIMCGLPGSGKSTWACNYLKYNPNTVIINKDKIREMINGFYVFDNDREPLVKEIWHSAINSMLPLNVDIIIDETNITRKKRDELFLCIKIGAERIGTTIDVAIVYCQEKEKCLERRMKEPRGYTEQGWREVIEKMMESFEPPTPQEGEVVLV